MIHLSFLKQSLWTGCLALLVLFLSGCDASKTTEAPAQEADARETDLTLRYDAPAEDWQSECLPIGNGRLGAMIYGRVDREQIQFNEDSDWIGDEQGTGSYQAFGDLMIEFDSSDPASAATAFSDYRRELDINKAIQTVSYEKGGIRYQREYFASHPANVLVFRLTADQPGAFSGRLSLKDAHGGSVGAEGNEVFFSGTLSGKHSLSGKGGEPNYKIRLDYEARGWAHRAENGIFGGQTFKWYLGDAPWLLNNLWDHYTFTLDREYLETRAYPLIKEQCQF